MIGPCTTPDCILLAVASDDNGRAIAARLSADGWNPCCVRDGFAVIAALRRSAFALVWLSSELPGPDPDRIAAHIARLPAPVPILVVDRSRPLPTDAVLRGLAAPPRTVAPRPDPLARLTPLFGRDGITRLLLNLRERLGTLLAAADPLAIGEGATMVALAHRFGGLAGTLDFPELAAAWLSVETDGEDHLPDAWTETRIAVALLDRCCRLAPGRTRAPPDRIPAETERTHLHRRPGGDRHNGEEP